MIIIPYRITEKFIREHQELTFVYSTDLRNHGGLGMQWFMAGCPNSFPIPTLVKFCANSEYFSDYQLKDNTTIFESWIKCIPTDRPLIVPPKIGLGCARMKEKCPLTYKYLREELNKMMSHDYKIDYSNIY